MGYFLIVDAGTGSGRAVVFDTMGRQVSIAQQEWEHLSVKGVENSMDFDYTKNWSIIARCIKEAIFKAGLKASEISAVTATSMREGIVLYDKEGKELFAVANVDARADKEVRAFKQADVGIEKRFYEQSGQTFALGALPRIMWVKNNLPDVYDKIASVNMISDWVLTKLSGVIATDPSNGGTTGVFSLEKRQWVPQMAKELGIKDDIFPPVHETGTIIGEVTALASSETGLLSGTKVVMGGGDVQLGSAGLGVVKPNDVAILGGTFWQQFVNMDETKVDPNMNIRINPHVIPGISQAEGITFFSGLVMRWFRDTLGRYEKEQALKEGIDPYAYLERLAKDVPLGSHGIMPIFSDTMKYGKWYHASPSFLNLSIDPNIANIASMFRSLEENAAIVSMLNLEEIFKFTGVSTDTITFAGGASKGPLWSQILADVTGKTIKIPAVTEATALGGAFACGVATGEYDSIASVASELVSWDKTYEPNPDNYNKYQDISVKWKEAYKAQLKLVDDKITTSMWQAPGL